MPHERERENLFERLHESYMPIELHSDLVLV